MSREKSLRFRDPVVAWCLQVCDSLIIHSDISRERDENTIWDFVFRPDNACSPSGIEWSAPVCWLWDLCGCLLMH